MTSWQPCRTPHPHPVKRNKSHAVRLDYATERWLKLAGTRTCQYGELRGETIALGLQALHRFLSKSKLFRRVKKCSPPPWNVDTLGYSALCPLKEPRAVVRGCASESRLKVHQRCDLIRLVARLLCSCIFPRGEPPAFHVGLSLIHI